MDHMHLHFCWLLMLTDIELLYHSSDCAVHMVCHPTTQKKSQWLIYNFILTLNDSACHEGPFIKTHSDKHSPNSAFCLSMTEHCSIFHCCLWFTTWRFWLWSINTLWFHTKQPVKPTVHCLFNNHLHAAKVNYHLSFQYCFADVKVLANWYFPLIK